MLDGFQERKSQLSSGIQPLSDAQALDDGPTSIHIWVALRRLSSLSFFQSFMKLGRGKLVGGQGRNWRGENGGGFSAKYIVLLYEMIEQYKEIIGQNEANNEQS